MTSLRGAKSRWPPSGGSPRGSTARCFEPDDLVVGNGSASELQGSNASYTATITPAASGAVTVDIAAGPRRTALATRAQRRCSSRFVAHLAPVPALPVTGALALALLLLRGRARRRTES